MRNLVINLIIKVGKALIALGTVLTILVYFLMGLPRVMEYSAIQENNWVLSFMVLTVLFWCCYIGYWAVKSWKK